MFNTIDRFSKIQRKYPHILIFIDILKTIGQSNQMDIENSFIKTAKNEEHPFIY